MHEHLPVTARQLIVLLAIGLIWGASFLFVRVLVVAGMQPFGVSGARCLLGAVSLAPVAYLLRDRFPRDRKTWTWLVALGLFNFAIPWTLFSLGQKHVPSGIGSIANSALPLSAAVTSTIMIKTERLGPTRIVGLLLGFAGVLVVVSGRVDGLDDVCRRVGQGVGLAVGAYDGALSLR